MGLPTRTDYMVPADASLSGVCDELQAKLVHCCAPQSSAMLLGFWRRLGMAPRSCDLRTRRRGPRPKRTGAKDFFIIFNFFKKRSTCRPYSIELESAVCSDGETTSS